MPPTPDTFAHVAVFPSREMRVNPAALVSLTSNSKWRCDSLFPDCSMLPSWWRLRVQGSDHNGMAGMQWLESQVVRNAKARFQRSRSARDMRGFRVDSLYWLEVCTVFSLRGSNDVSFQPRPCPSQHANRPAQVVVSKALILDQ